MTPFAQLIFACLMMKMPFYTNIKGRMVVYWLSNIGVSLHFRVLNRQILTWLLGWCWSFDFELDQRDLFR